ncbi:MAG: hypothetical protein K1X28_03815 [Parachlamydiales bacterium]|nr:hypothetical protein [Parachlamydiales bacterium]
MKTIAINNYNIDAKNFVVSCNNQKVGCVETATKITQLSKKTFGIFEWLKFYAIDLLADIFQSFKEKQFTIVKLHAQKIIFDQNKYLKGVEKVDRFVREHFEIVSKNVDHIHEAEVICLGETHETLSHMLRNAQLIDALGEPNDLILVEHDETRKERSDQARFVRKPIEVKGWDKRDPELMEELAAAYDINPNDVIMQILFGDKPTDRTEEVDAILQKIVDNLPERNESMCKTVEENSCPGRRIYVISGQGHLKPPTSLVKDGINLEGQKRAFDETLEYLKTKKYAILVPHDEKPRLRLWGLGGG